MSTLPPFFITGTDTNIGKTYISTGLLQAFNKKGYSTLGIKPIASGCFYEGDALRNADAQALQQVSSVKLDYHYINPFAFLPPIAPHIAAEQINQPLAVNGLLKQCHYALQAKADIKIIEGVGGWHVPLNKHETMADFVIQGNFTVILVVGIRLGCLNHALLTAQALHLTPLRIAGWIANGLLPEQPENERIIATLQQWLPMPYLGEVRYQQPVDLLLDTLLLT